MKSRTHYAIVLTTNFNRKTDVQVLAIKHSYDQIMKEFEDIADEEKENAKNNKWIVFEDTEERFFAGEKKDEFKNCVLVIIDHVLSEPEKPFEEMTSDELVAFMVEEFLESEGVKNLTEVDKESLRSEICNTINAYQDEEYGEGNETFLEAFVEYQKLLKSFL